MLCVNPNSFGIINRTFRLLTRIGLGQFVVVYKRFLTPSGSLLIGSHSIAARPDTWLLVVACSGFYTRVVYDGSNRLAILRRIWYP